MISLSIKNFIIITVNNDTIIAEITALEPKYEALSILTAGVTSLFVVTGDNKINATIDTKPVLKAFFSIPYTFAPL